MNDYSLNAINDHSFALTICLLAAFAATVSCLRTCTADEPWVVYDGNEGPGKGKHIVFITGDDEYRSEEGMPMLARILAVRHGFKCTILFAIDPRSGMIAPDYQNNIPGLELLREADMMVIFARFRELPDEQMKHIVDFLDTGKPILGLRPSTHAFNYAKHIDSAFAKYSWNSKNPPGGFGQLVLGDTWVNHHGRHRHESTRGVINEKHAGHPILRGVDDIWGPTDVYGIAHFPEDAQVLVRGQVLAGMKPSDVAVEGGKNDPMMPLVWFRNYTGGSGRTSRVICTTMGSSTDLESAGLRRLLVNACYWGLGLESKIPAASSVEYVGAYEPTNYGFGTYRHGMRPEDHKIAFNGRTLDGWHKVGGEATFTVENGQIIGRQGPGPNTFLRTKHTYGDFVLRLKLKLEISCNSGIQIRSQQRDGDGVVFGYQCEVDPSNRAWSGGIYDESRRGWLFPLDGMPDAQRAFKKDDWNEYTIRAVGPHIRSWVNGVPCADLIDPMDMEGFISLQVHAGQQGKVLWRDIDIYSLGRSEWKPLWNGKDLDGWERLGPGNWKIEDGQLHGTQVKEVTSHSVLLTANRFRDFAVRCQFKVNQGDSGFYFRAEKSYDALFVHGFQSEIENNLEEVSGLYETAGRGWVQSPDPEVVAKHFKNGDWNDLSIVANGRRVVVHLNGYKTVERMNDPGREEGHIGLQMHGGQDMDVLFREIEMIEL